MWGVGGGGGEGGGGGGGGGFFFNDTATTEIYTLSLHDALPICQVCRVLCQKMCGNLMLNVLLFYGKLQNHASFIKETCKAHLQPTLTPKSNRVPFDS